MKLIKTTLQLLLLCVFISTTSCKEEYPDLEDGLYAEIVTSKDTMIAKLFYDKVPVTVANFVALAEGNHPLVDDVYKGKRFYDSLTFHRVMDKFMIQGGDPMGTGAGSPGYRFTADFDASLKHDKAGVLSMANSGNVNTNGSQFFITEVPYPSLDAFNEDGTLKPCDQPRVSCHSVFGQLVKGIEVQDAISNVPVARGNKPVEPVYITQVNIIRKGSGAKSFNAPKVFESQLPEVETEIQGLLDEGKRIKEEKLANAIAETKPMLDEYTANAEEFPSGLKKYLISSGTDEKPSTGQAAMIAYEGYFPDGRLFDSNVKAIAEKYGMFDARREAMGGYGATRMVVSPDAALIAGFKEAIASMTVGEKAFFYLPYHLAYGEGGRPGIPAKADLTFILEMKEITK
ncbi:peptidylprolyl isomerase [Psychroserpens sp.]|uniref:peptidylprolyl isomerase n=1 Tax=Psychroserpens sp. TaxID=2020870 RepID=UPI001B2E1E39|nr:peptidylprolyl isomerase [Psychroserpens sp.]MBO6606318.1 peptidylprolyl isomerase [Psychroserpens sp.]MBO6632452.1 peptidylprolyl isomerase [Psychroserpens sp.]MBO6653022.1 peptidylprolyl isomerase [Psychroserpens sp.]MBO6680951.1 peptidylprolyl isomerase [Psychroserpens sp.]MBO6750093.1 peptidylprolyl isomerase [Psychroserpens sp.]